MKLFSRFVLAACTVGLLGACASTPDPKPKITGGFIGDYSRLQPYETPSDSEVWRWVDREIQNMGYSSLYIQPLVFYPAPTTSDQVSIDALEDLRKALEETVKESARSHKLPLVETPQQGSLVLRAALTSVKLSYKEFSVREIIPIRLVFSGAELAMGKRDKDMAVMLEYELLDAATNRVWAQGVRKDQGMPVVNDKTRMSIKNAEPVLKDLILDLDREFGLLTKKVFSSKQL